MDREYKLDKEYSVMEIIRYNLRMWWLAAIFALVCAAILGGYKYKSNHEFVERVVYDNVQQVNASVFVKAYTDEASVERVNTIIKIANSNRAYEKMIENTGWLLDYQGYVSMFDLIVGDVSNVASLFVNYPTAYGDFQIADADFAAQVAEEIINATDEVSREMTGKECISVLDAPFATTMVQKIETYFITEDEFWKGNLKAATAGFLLGIIVEVVLYTCWMLLYKKPKNAEEIRQCLEAPIIDTLKDGKDSMETFRKVALALKDDCDDAAVQKNCRRINCMSCNSQGKDAALKVAMIYAGEQKKTLYINLASDGAAKDSGNVISGYILGEAHKPKPLAMNEYLDTVCGSAEKGFDLVANSRFAEYLEQESNRYDCIVINSQNVADSLDAMIAATLCEKTFFVCSRKNVKNETLYRIKNESDVYHIKIDGILVYE